MAGAPRGAATIEPFQFRVRATAAAAEPTVARAGQRLGVQLAHLIHPPAFEPNSFTWGFGQMEHLIKLESAEGAWSNWTAVSTADLKVAAARDARTGDLPNLLLTLGGTWTGTSATVLPPFALAEVDVEFADEQLAGAALSRRPPPVASVQLSATLGFKVTRGARSANLGMLLSKVSKSLSVQTFREYNTDTFWGEFPTPLPPAARPKLFPLIDRLITDSDVENEHLGLAALAGLGYTGLGCSFSNGPHTKAVFTKAGLQWTSSGGHIPSFGFYTDEESNITKDASGWVAGGLEAGFNIADIKALKIADEPGWYYPSVYEAAANDSATVAHWHVLLQTTAGFHSPSQLLARASSWDEIVFTGRSAANGTLTDRRRFYWTQRMFSLESARFYSNATRTFEKVLGPAGPRVFANWNNFAGRMFMPGDNGGESHNQAKTDPDEATAAHDWFDFARARGGSMLWTEDWSAPASWWSFEGSKLSAAGALSGLPWGGYIVPRSGALTAGDMVQRVAALIGSGGKTVIYYNFGPDCE